MNFKGSTHLVPEDRKLIEKLLNDGLKCCQIARQVNKDERTISKEIVKRRNRTNNGRYGLYGKKDDIPCPTLNRFPYVCNNCKKKQYCCKEFKYFYDWEVAQDNYEIILKDSRIGLDVSPEAKEHFDKILKEGIDKGQSIYHIVNANKDTLRYSVRSAYRIVKNNQTVIQPLNLRRAVKLRPRRHYDYKEDNKAIRKGRTYKDFLTRIARETAPSITEIDTVESVREGQHKCLLTIHHTLTHFMIVIVLESKTKCNVSSAINNLKNVLGIDLFKKLFCITLTDRGTEFCDPLSVEIDFETGEKICDMFYCNSYSSYQKGAIEENHELVRYFIPKYSVFDNLTQNQATLMACHINSLFRESIETSPVDLAATYFGEEFLNKFGIRAVDPDSVVMNPSIFLKTE